MVKFSFTDVMELLPQIQQFQDNYNRIMSNGHSKLSEDLESFMFCSSLPESYQPTAQQYLNNITVIANYKLMHKSSKKSLEERLKQLDKACPSTSSPL